MCLPQPPSRRRVNTLCSAVFSLSVGLAACSQPPATSNAVTPAEALCALLPNTPDDDLPTDRRDESMQQLDLATRCNSALRRHR
ncbi:hypothetical protein CFBP8129_34960 [Xanthomonas hortorum pv. gardneri]|uniref:Secreted protein n=1 Tax=Xanthomonas hortorum pv. gardneri TaxID=2754056 RepID=A0A6V7EE56_9XANT|nr:hypothetical protein BJD10_07650 [Xanthomonas hortorum pv. gardneri]PPU49684.1 hypothetical protein XcyCFBP4188_00270 [Xanthomonas hortorum pv. cynarae]CAD0310212.1 hypothetical protein NCPPB940_09890 [Xanthomonas hortorum pv. taraxaci]CAH2707178.1 hypothetical protein NCPPB1935_05235 [Xanthomonas campestris pv. nigromaculans]CAD0310221.1 hypothetical protein NCPPB940_09890 [Xanthomonas hortorum pv. taraxaci]